MTELVNLQLLDRNIRPGPGPLPVVSLPAIQKSVLSNGLAFWLVERHQLPIVACNMVVNAGTTNDAVILPGVAEMTAQALEEGTRDLDAQAIARKLENLGATFSARAGVDATSAFLSTLTKHLDEALALYAALLCGPAFPEKEIARLKQLRLTEILQQRDRAAVTANLAFVRICYGPLHPRGNDPGGTEASVSAMTRSDIEKYYATYYRPNNATLIVVGDVSMEDLMSRLEKALGTWKSAPLIGTELQAIPSRGNRRVYLIDKPGAAQSEIRIGYPALAHSSPEFFPATVMNRILGGQFSSRINLNLRERRGLTYGARSDFSFTRQPGPFVTTGGFISAKTDTALEQLFFELERMRSDGITPEELAFSKTGISGSFALSFETSMQIAGALQRILIHGLPDDYYQNYLENVEKVTLEDVQRVAESTLRTDQMAVVVVGDVKIIRPQVESLTLGEIVLCARDGRAEEA